MKNLRWVVGGQSRFVTILLCLVFMASLLFDLSGPANNTGQTAAPNLSYTPQKQVYTSQVHTNIVAASTSTPAQMSENWSGYVALGTVFTKTQARFVVPKVTCTVAKARTSIWSGFDGYANNTAEQAGIEVACAGATGKTPQYSAWWEMYPTNTEQAMPLTIVPGNVITVNVNYVSGKYFLEVVDGTKSYSKTVSCAAGLVCARAYAEWIVERPSVKGAYTSLGSWGMMQMYSDTAASTSGLAPITHYTYTALNMESDSGNYLATVSTLGTGGASFYDYWKAAQ